MRRHYQAAALAFVLAIVFVLLNVAFGIETAWVGIFAFGVGAGFLFGAEIVRDDAKRTQSPGSARAP